MDICAHNVTRITREIVEIDGGGSFDDPDFRVSNLTIYRETNSGGKETTRDHAVWRHARELQD